MTGKDPVSPTAFGDLQERTASVESDNARLLRRLTEQDEELRKISTQGRLTMKQVDGQGHELTLVKQSTARIEAVQCRLAEKIEPIDEALQYGKKTFALVEWLVKRFLPLVAAVGALIGGIGWLKG
jgi:chromosome segregation ATPase